jgi:hypothetical protein
MGVCQDGDIVRVTAKFVYQDLDEFMCVFHMKLTLTGGASDGDVHDAIAVQLDDGWANLVTSMNQGVDFTTIETWNVTQDRPMWADEWPTLTSATGAADMLPTQCAALSLFDTQVARSQGRKFLPGFTEGINEAGGDLTSTVIAAITSWAAEIMLGISITEGTGEFGNWNKTLSRFADWVYHHVSPILRTQRRRVRGVGT